MDNIYEEFVFCFIHLFMVADNIFYDDDIIERLWRNIIYSGDVQEACNCPGVGRGMGWECLGQKLSIISNIKANHLMLRESIVISWLPVSYNEHDLQSSQHQAGQRTQRTLYITKLKYDKFFNQQTGGASYQGIGNVMYQSINSFMKGDNFSWYCKYHSQCSWLTQKQCLL